MASWHDAGRGAVEGTDAERRPDHVGDRDCARWGRRLALAILTANLVGDATNALLRDDLRTLIGLPIGGALIAYLMSARVRVGFAKATH